MADQQQQQQQKPEPSQVTGQLTSAQGQVYQAVGAVLPESLGSASWTESGAELQKQGEEEVRAAKVGKQVDATVDSASAKLKTATGYLTGDQEKQTEGNLEAEKASWDYKQASSDKPLDIPVPSAKGVEGKVESVVGMVTGDAEKQKRGNVKAENAAWTDGV